VLVEWRIEMKEHSRILIQLLSTAIREQKPASSLLTEMASHNLNHIWNEIYDEALAHEVHTLIYPILSDFSPELKPDNNLMSKWKRETFLSAAEQINHMEMISKVFTRFHEEDIPVIALKGLVIRDYYPQPELRTMGDADILVKNKDIKKAKKVLKEMGYCGGEDSIKHIHYYHETSLSLELHWVITEQDDKKELSDFTEQVWKHAIHTNLCGVPVLALSTEDQLVHLFIHALTHLRTSGFGLRQICDIVLFMEANDQSINWPLVMDMLNEYHIHNFFFLIINVCSQLFQYVVPNEVQDNKCHVPDTMTHIVIEEIIHSGVYGRRSYEQETSVRINKYIHVTGETVTKEAGGNKFKNIILFVFPSHKKLNYQYKYAKKIPILLPIAWLHRGVINLKRLNTMKQLGNPDIITTVNARSKLLHWLQQN
jgi:hypothetical protein